MQLWLLDMSPDGCSQEEMRSAGAPFTGPLRFAGSSIIRPNGSIPASQDQPFGSSESLGGERVQSDVAGALSPTGILRPGGDRHVRASG
jgi:hypothetical protein